MIFPLIRILIGKSQRIPTECLWLRAGVFPVLWKVWLDWKELLKRMRKSCYLCHAFFQWYLFSAEFSALIPSLLHPWAFWKIYHKFPSVWQKLLLSTIPLIQLPTETNKKARQPDLIPSLTWPGCHRKKIASERRRLKEFPRGINLTLTLVMCLKDVGEVVDSYV